MNTKNLFRNTLLCTTLALGTLATSCSKDETGKGDQNSSETIGSFFISTTTEGTGSVILNAEQLDSGLVSTVGNGIALSYSYTNWIFNKAHKVAFGLYYAQGDPGQGTAYKLAEDGTLVKSGADVQIADRFTTYGIFKNFAITAVSGVVDSLSTPGQTDTISVFNYIDVSVGNAITRKTISTRNFAGNNQTATFSGLVDMGNEEFLMGVVLSGPRPDTATGGSSTGYVMYPDSCFVAAFDKDLNVKRIYRDGRLSYSSGRFKSQYYSQIALDDNKNAYVFSGAYDPNTTKKAGAIRIMNGATSFDQNYYFDIQTAAGGYKFRKVWHVTGDYFLIEFYNEQVSTITSTVGATQYGIVNMTEKTFKWLADSGFPTKDVITSVGTLTTHNGKAYIPVNTNNSIPTIYVLDPKTGVCTKGMEVNASTISAVGRLSL